MPWFDHHDGKVWATFHSVLGPIVGDPKDQAGVLSDECRFFVARMSCCLFLKRDEVNATIQDVNDVKLLQDAVDSYCASRCTLDGIECDYSVSKSQNKREAEVVGNQYGGRPCTYCNAVIPPERLNAVPGSTLCVRCQEKAENVKTDTSHSGEICPRCRSKGIQSQLIWKRAHDPERSGEFLGCARFPECRYIARN